MVFINCDKKTTVTCFYCYFHKLHYISEKDFDDKGYCKLKNIPKLAFDKICEEFKIKPCIHTKKYYPGKIEK